jgi:BirA family biotin operon repressor/biotin-[acetyl-CoA-carboxylase] ligase
LTTASGSWRLACHREHFDPARFASRFPGKFARDLEVWESLESTNSRAWELVASGERRGALVLAEEQRAGRGRQGRRWLCPAHGGLLFSFVEPLVCAPGTRAPILSLALAVAVCDALRQCTGRDVRLKWPNDLVVGEGKLAGLLVEARHAETPWLVVGCGINVRVRPDFLAAHPDLRARSLHDDGEPLPPREWILAEVVQALEEACALWAEGRNDAVLERWEALDTLRGRDVEARLPQGVERGRVLGITDTGLLRLRLPSGAERLLSAGEVHLQ